MNFRGAFTLIEVLVSIALISLVLLGLYQSLTIQQSSNRQLKTYLDKAIDRSKVVTTLYKDLLCSDGNLTLTHGDFDRLCIHSTTHTLYHLPHPKVCWLVLKENNTLVRTEGGNYDLPTKPGQPVMIDLLIKGMHLFSLTRKGDKILVAFEATNQHPIAFMLQGLSPPPKPKKPAKAKKDSKQKRESPKQQKSIPQRRYYEQQ